MARQMISATLVGYSVFMGVSLTGCGGGVGDTPSVSSSNTEVTATIAVVQPTPESAAAAIDTNIAVDDSLDIAVAAAHAGNSGMAFASTVILPEAAITAEAVFPAADVASDASADAAPNATAQAARGSETRLLDTPAVAAVTQARIDRVEQFANDGSSQSQPVANHWGLNQTRITTHADGTVRALYLRSVNATTLQWRVMKRSPTTGTWREEAIGLSLDDVTLSRDPVSDVAHVLAWPGSIPTVLSSPSFAPKPVPGTWQLLPGSSRHYGGTGIGADGLFCMKASVESATPVPTTLTKTTVTCGRHTASTNLWTWQPQQEQYVDLRRAYDYLFPGAFGLANTLVGTSQLDLYKSAAGLNSLSGAAGDYVFNGVSLYSFRIDTKSALSLSNVVTPLVVPTSSNSAPVARQWDAFVDSKRRMLSTYFVETPVNAAARGSYLSVANASGQISYQGRMAELPSYGFTRVFEDSKARLWILWTNLGSQATQVVLYRLNEQGGSFVLGDKLDLSASFSNLAIQGSPYLAVPRGGQTIGNSINGLLVACDGQFVSGKLASCSPSGVNRQRLVHFQLRLPD